MGGLSLVFEGGWFLERAKGKERRSSDSTSVDISAVQKKVMSFLGGILGWIDVVATGYVADERVFPHFL